MSDETAGSAGPTSAPAELGVVDPIRLPDVVRSAQSGATAAWSRLPGLGKAFVVLAIVDVALRAVGFAGTSLFIDLGSPITIVAAVFAHTLPILLPALLLARRPDAATATPLVLRGVVVLALVELLHQPVSGLAFGVPDGSGFVAGIGIGIARSLVSAAGWLAIALGLAAVTSSRPGPALAGLSNLVLAALVGAAIVTLGVGLVVAPPDLGDPTWNSLSMVNNAMLSVEAAAIAYFAWIVVRGTSDARRPQAARYLATGALVVGAAFAAISAAIGALVIVQVVFALSTGPLGGEFGLLWIGTWPVTAAVLVALALGLADDSVRLPARDGGDVPPKATPEVRWPGPGGEIPS